MKTLLAFLALAILPLLALAPGCASPSRGADGAALYANRCSLCHTPYSPSDFPSGVWAANLKRYGPRAGLSERQRDLVLDYLRAHSSDASAFAAPGS